MLVIWNERAKPRCERAGAESAVMSSPAKRTRPRSGTRSPASWPISVVLPAPFGPMIACVSPSSTSRSTLSLASSAPKLLVRPRTSSRTLFILAEEQSREAALEEEHREHQQRTQDQLPVLGPARERVFEEQQRACEPAHRARDHERREPVWVRREADRARARLVRPRGTDHHAESRIDQAVAEEEEQHQDREHQVVEGNGVVEIDKPKLAPDLEAHAVVAA